MAKTFKLTVTNDRTRNVLNLDGTVAELVQKCSQTLECGKSYQHEKGNAKINCHPTTIKSLVTNLNNAVNNSAANGYAGKTYSAVEV